MGRSLARGGRGKERSSVGIHIQEHTTPPPSIGVAAPAPVCIAATAAMLVVPTTPAVHVEHTTPPPSIGVAAQPPVRTPASLVGFSTPMAHASESTTSDPISSSVGEIPVIPSSQPSSSSGSSSLPQLFVGPGG
ncbi:hypothetical protein Droror1_Dr00020260 [Drosera rotundifolia]